VSDVRADGGPVTAPTPASRWTDVAMQRRLRRRYVFEGWFRRVGLAAISLSILFLAFLLWNMGSKGIGGFTQYEASLPIDFTKTDLFLDPAQLRGPDAEQQVAGADLSSAIAKAAGAAYGPAAANMFSDAATSVVTEAIVRNPDILKGRATLWLPVGSKVDIAAKSQGDPAAEQIVTQLNAEHALRRTFNSGFLTASDATDPSAVGVWGALKGTFYTILVTIALAFPIGVLASVYLEEFAPKSWWSDAIEVSINNLAAVPSIIFGLLGLAVFLDIMNLPRSAPLVGGMTLALMTFPVIVIAGRNAIKSVPPSIREAAMGVGASKMQVTFHHVLPLALPGILTGTIIGVARALGETAPLLLIGMRAFVAAPPHGITDPATVLPVQIFLWSDEVDRSFVEKTSAAIIVLLLFMLMMNGLAIYLRNRFERRW
jgi:phosphate transport system permease protein